MKKIAFIICLIVLLMAFTSINKASAQKPIELSCSTFFAPGHPHALNVVEWAKEIEKRTNGRVKITVFPGGTLTPADKCYQGVIDGISDIGVTAHGYTPGRFPLTTVIDLPLGYGSAVVNTKLINEFHKKFQPKELDDTKWMYVTAHEAPVLHTKKPVHNLEDLKGMKIRTAGTVARIIALLGGVPVSMPMPDVYDALSKGVIDGLVGPLETLKSHKFAEVVNYTTKFSKTSCSGLVLTAMNKDKWNALPPDIKKIIEKTNQDWIKKTAELWEWMAKDGEEFALKLDHKTIVLSKEEEERWAKAVKPLPSAWAQEMEAKGLPGEEALKFCMDYLEKNR
jgi:TRAP-type C4-dicarboxylate transport system substrate-binding protein